MSVLITVPPSLVAPYLRAPVYTWVCVQLYTMLLVPHYGPKQKLDYQTHIMQIIFCFKCAHCAGTLSISGSLFLNLKVVFLFWQNCRHTCTCAHCAGNCWLATFACVQMHPLQVGHPHAQFCLTPYRKDQAIQNGWWGGGGGGDQWLPLRRLLRPHEEDDLHRLGRLRCHPTSGSHIPRAKSLFCELQVWRIRSTLADIQCAQTSRFTMS